MQRERSAVAWLLLLVLGAVACSRAPTPRSPAVANVHLTGTVVSSPPGVALTGVEVRAIGPAPRTTLIDASGGFEFVDLVRGAYRLCVTLTSIDGGQVCSSIALDSDDNHASPLVVAPLGDLHGRVLGAGVDAQPKPIAGVWVGALGEPAVAITDAAGEYQLKGVHVGLRSLYAVSAGYELAINQSMTVEWNQDAAVSDMTLTGAPLALEPLHGTVELIGHDAAMATNDVTQVSVTIEPIHQTVVCDTNGSWGLMVPAGVYSLSIVGPRRQYDVPRVLVGNGHNYIVDGSLHELATLGLPIGHRLDDRHVWTWPVVPNETSGAAWSHLITAAGYSASTLTSIELYAVPDLKLQYESPALAVLGVDDHHFYLTRVHADGLSEDVVSVDIDTFTETVVLPNLAKGLYQIPTTAGDDWLAWNGDGQLININDSGKEIVATVPFTGPLDLPLVRAADSLPGTVTISYPLATSANFVTHRLELRNAVTGALLDNIEDIDATIIPFTRGQRLFYQNGTVLYGSTGQGNAQKLFDHVNGVNGVELIGDTLFALTSNGSTIVWRPSDGLTLSFNDVVVAGDGFLATVDDQTQEFHLTSAPQTSIATVPGGYADPTNTRYYFFTPAFSTMGSDWSALSLSTGAIVHLGVGLAPTEVNDRFYYSVYQGPGSMSPTLHRHEASGADVQVATDVYAYRISPTGARILIQHGGYRLAVLTSENAVEETIGYGNVTDASWWTDDELKWTASGDETRESPGSFLTEFFTP